jgi:hypothetical protein
MKPWCSWNRTLSKKDRGVKIFKGGVTTLLKREKA